MSQESVSLDLENVNAVNKKEFSYQEVKDYILHYVDIIMEAEDNRLDLILQELIADTDFFVKNGVGPYTPGLDLTRILGNKVLGNKNLDNKSNENIHTIWGLGENKIKELGLWKKYVYYWNMRHELN